MKTAELIDAYLDYWTARAEGVRADELEIRPVQRPDPGTPSTICVRKLRGMGRGTLGQIRLDYSTNWAMSGALVDKHLVAISKGSNQITFPGWAAELGLTTAYGHHDPMMGETACIAICRAVVRSVFGDEVHTRWRDARITDVTGAAPLTFK